MSLNYSKFSVLSLSLKHIPNIYTYMVNRHRLESVSKHTDLGVMIDSKLTFTQHVNSAVSSGRKLLGMITRLRKGLPMSALIVVYIAFVRSRLEYASVIWNSIGKGSSDRIESVQRKLVKYLCFSNSFNYDDVDYRDWCLLFKLLCLKDRCTYLICFFFLSL